MDDDFGNPSDVMLDCHVCGQRCERPDMWTCEDHDAFVCSRCLSTDKRAEHVLGEQAPAGRV